MAGLKRRDQLYPEDMKVLSCAKGWYLRHRETFKRVEPKTLAGNAGTYTNEAYRALMAMEREARSLLSYIDADVAALLVEAAEEREQLQRELKELRDGTVTKVNELEKRLEEMRAGLEDVKWGASNT